MRANLSAIAPTDAHAARWDDAQVEPSSISMVTESFRGGPAVAPYYRHDVLLTVQAIVRPPWGWDRATAIRPVLYVVPAAAGAGTAVFLLSYAWSAPGAELPAVWASTTLRLPIVAGDQWRTMLVSGPLVPPRDGAPAGSALWCVWQRGGLAGETYTTGKATGVAQANVALVSTGARYQRTSAGEVREP